MLLGILKDTYPGERRVALVPASLPPLTKAGFTFLIEPGAGISAGHADAAYLEKGAQVASSRADVFAKADLLVQVRALGADPNGAAADLPMFRQGQTLVATCDPLSNPEPARRFASSGGNAFALELAPRITRAQSMDVLSSMATLAGYKAALLAATNLPKIFPMMMTAAGTVTAARALVIGAGVAGLQAIATCRKLGAVVSGYDVRAAVKEQVMSLGAKFVELELETQTAEGKGGYAAAQDETFLRRQRELMARVVADSDVVITTAAIPGKRSPVIVTADMVRGMAAGSVIVDLAAERGGNCELSRPDETVIENGVTILAPTNLPATVPMHASQLFGRNVANFLLLLVKDGKVRLDGEDEILRETLLVREGELAHPSIGGASNAPTGATGAAAAATSAASAATATTATSAAPAAR